MPPRDPRLSLRLVPASRHGRSRGNVVYIDSGTQAPLVEAPARRNPRGALTPRQAAKAAAVVFLAAALLLYAFKAWAGGEPTEAAHRAGSPLPVRLGERPAASLASDLDTLGARLLWGRGRVEHWQGWTRQPGRMP